MAEEKFITYGRSEYDVVFTMEEATAIRREYFDLYGEMKNWHTKAMHTAWRRGYTETPFGRRRSFTDRDDLNAAINTPVQSTAWDLTALAMIQAVTAIKLEGLDAVCIGAIHDSILFDVADEHAERLSQLVIHHMENVDTRAFGFTVPLPLVAEAQVGQTWEKAA